ncbi:mCG141054 [Mus musculus]|nr:mCG141054 [Mus musculus]
MHLRDRTLHGSLHFKAPGNWKCVRRQAGGTCSVMEKVIERWMKTSLSTCCYLERPYNLPC